MCRVETVPTFTIWSPVARRIYTDLCRSEFYVLQLLRKQSVLFQCRFERALLAINLLNQETHCCGYIFNVLFTHVFQEKLSDFTVIRSPNT